MGSSKQTTTNEPWKVAQPGLTGTIKGVEGLLPSAPLNSTEQGALGQLTANAQQGNPYAPQVGQLATDLLGGGNNYSSYVTNALGQLQNNIGGTASGQYLDPNTNPFFKDTTNAISNDIQNRINGMFQGGGRSFSGMNQYALAKGLTEGTAPIYSQIYNAERDRQLGAAGTLAQAGAGAAGLLSGLDQTALGNRAAGVDMAGRALGANDYGANRLLEIEAQRRGIPLNNYGQIAGILGPMGQLGGTSVTQTSANPFQVALGGLLGGAGLFGGMFGATGPFGKFGAFPNALSWAQKT